MATVCAITVRSVTPAWVVGIYLACRQQHWAVGVSRAQRSPSPALPGFLVLRIGLVPQLGASIPIFEATRSRLQIADDQGTHPGLASFLPCVQAPTNTRLTLSHRRQQVGRPCSGDYTLQHPLIGSVAPCAASCTRDSLGYTYDPKPHTGQDAALTLDANPGLKSPCDRTSRRRLPSGSLRNPSPKGEPTWLPTVIAMLTDSTVGCCCKEPTSAVKARLPAHDVPNLPYLRH